ncbi:MAG: hypothetical protein ACRDTE_08080 [Pseudonocardiaceae bacterium]
MTDTRTRRHVPEFDDAWNTRRADQGVSQVSTSLSTSSPLPCARRGARVHGGPLAPSYTHRAAVIYRRRKDYDAEIAIIERWEAACTPEPRERGAAQAALAERLTAARRLRHRAQYTGQ